LKSKCSFPPPSCFELASMSPNWEVSETFTDLISLLVLLFFFVRLISS
jgi:hypothetical protein